MKKIFRDKFDENDCDEYILIKIPRQVLRQSILASLDSYSADKNIQRIILIMGCIISILLGIAIGASFHDKFLNESTNKPAWKNSSLQNSNSN